MYEGTDDSSFPVHSGVAGGPDRRRPHVTGRHYVFRCELVEPTCVHTGMNGFLSGLATAGLSSLYAGLMSRCSRDFFKCAWYWSAPASAKGPAAWFSCHQQAEVAWRGVRAVRREDQSAPRLPASEELLIGKVRPKHQQDFAVHHGVIAGRDAQQPGHTDIDGLSYSMNSFPRMAWTMGAFNRRRWQSAHHELLRIRRPQEWLSFPRRDSGGSRLSEFVSAGCTDRRRRQEDESALSGFSHRHVAWQGMTETPRRVSAVRIAISSTRGICSGCEISSQ